MTETIGVINTLIINSVFEMPKYTIYKTRFKEINQEIVELLKDFLSSIWVVIEQTITEQNTIEQIMFVVDTKGAEGAKGTKG